MKVVVIKAFGSYVVGDVIPDMPENQARTLMARNLVREVEDIASSRADRMIRRPAVRKGG